MKNVKQKCFFLLISMLSIITGLTFFHYSRQLDMTINTFIPIFIMILINLELFYWSDILRIEEFGNGVISATIFGKIISFCFVVCYSLLFLPFIHFMYYFDFTKLKILLIPIIIIFYIWMNSFKIDKNYYKVNKNE